MHRLRTLAALVPILATLTVVSVTPATRSAEAGVADLPVPAAPIVSTSTGGTIYLREDGSVWTFGTTGMMTQAAPTHVMDGIVDVAAGTEHVVALRPDGTAIAWGHNLYGQLGPQATVGALYLSTGAVTVLDDVVDVDAGSNTTYLLRSDHSLWALGANFTGQLGVPTGAGGTDPHPVPVQVMDHVLSVHAGLAHVLVIDDQHRLWSFGLNGNGQLGRTTAGSWDNAPRLVATGVRTASAGGHHSLLVSRDGTVSAVGYGFASGDLITSRAFGAPFRELPIQGAALVASDDVAAAVLLADGSLYSVDIVGLSPVVSRVMQDASSVSIGGGLTAVAKIDGTLWTFGRSVTDAQLGRSAGGATAVPGRVDAGLVGTGFRALVPARLLDTRPSSPTADGLGAGGGPVTAGSAVTVQVAGRAGVPAAGAVAAVLNIAVTESSGAGFVTAYPCDEAMPTAANLNHLAGQTTSNSVVAKLDLDGRVCLYTLSAAHLVVDVQGWFGIGAYLPATPRRLMESRGGLSTVDGRDNAIGPRQAGSTTALDVRYRSGIADATAVVLNVAAVDASEPGFITASTCGGVRPTAANLTYVAGQTVPNLVIAPVADGQTCLYAYGRTHLVVDAAGGFPEGGNGFHALGPARLADTRAGYPTSDGSFAGGGALGRGSTWALDVVGRAGVPVEAAAVVLGLTAVAAAEDGFVTVFPCGEAKPTAANLNITKGATASNTSFARLGTAGRVCIYSYGVTDLVVDVGGWFPA